MMTEKLTYIYYDADQFTTLIETATSYYDLRGNWSEGLTIGSEIVGNKSNNNRMILSPDKWYEVSSVLVRPSIELTLVTLIATPDRQKVTVVIRDGITNINGLMRVRLDNIEFVDGEFFADIPGFDYAHVKEGKVR